MKITKRQLRRIIKEEQMTLNQSGVDAVLAMADQVEPMFRTLTKTAGQSDAALDPLYEEVEAMLLDLPSYLREIAKKMKEQGVEGGLNVEAKVRRKVRQLLLSEFFGLGKKKATTPKFPEVDLQKLGEIIEEHAFEEDVPANSPRRDLSIDKNLEWLASSDEEIKRLGKAYRRSPEEVQAFLDLDLEQRKKMIRGR